MRKHRKLLALLVALTFLFSVAAPVMAAPAAEEKAAGTLNALGIIEGYPDGTFGLERDITRAEFAKIAVVAAGFGDAEGLMKNTPSKFSDVATGEWYTGWINLASAQGFVKGDPAGTFRPDAKISYAEVLTVLLRLVGYSDNLPGDWPMNYLTKAVQLGVTKGISFDASAPAVRGSVFALTEKVLDVPMVNWSKDKEIFVAVDPETKLIANSFKGDMYEGLVTEIKWNKGVAKLFVNEVVEKGFKKTSYNLVSNAVISGASDVVALLGSRIDYVVNDDGDITYVGAKATKIWQSPSGLAKADATEVTLGAGASMTFDWSEGIKKAHEDAATGAAKQAVLESAITYFPVKSIDINIFAPASPPSKPLAGISSAGSADKIVGVFDSKGNIEHVFVYNYEGANLIEEIDGNTIFPEQGPAFTKSSSDHVVVVRNGEPASYLDLQEGDLIFKVEGDDARGLKALIFASDAVKSGVVDEYVGNSVTIGSVKYYLDNAALISDDNGKNYNGAIGKDTVGKEVNFMLSPGGKIGVLVSSFKVKSDTLYGILQGKDIPTAGSIDAARAKIFTAEGKSVVYEVSSAPYNPPATTTTGVEYLSNAALATLGDGVLVSYELNSRGQVSKIEKVTTDVTTFGSADGARILADSAWVRTASDVSIFRYNSAATVKWSVVEWDVAKNLLAAAGAAPVAVLDDGRLAAISYTSVAGTDLMYGVITYTANDSNGQFYDVLVNGAKTRYNTVSAYTYKAKDIVEFNLEAGKMSNIKTAGTTNSGDTVQGTVDNVGNSYLRIKLADDTYKYVDLSDDVTIVENITSSQSPVLATRVSRGATVTVYDLDEKGYYNFVVITKK